MKRILYLSLAVALALSALVGCGTPTPAPQTQGTANPDAAATPAPVDQTVDKLVLMKYLDTTQFLNSGAAVDAVRQVLRDKLYVDVVLLDQPTTDAAWFDTKIASGEQIDVFQPNEDWRKYKEQDVILPLTDLMNQYGQDILANCNPVSIKACSDSEGTIWAAPYECFNMYLTMIVRGDWMKKYNIATPKTFDDWEVMMQTFKDKEGDIGILQHWGGVYESVFSPSFIPCAGGYNRYLDDSGKLAYGLTNPGYKDYLAKMRDWYQKGYIVKEYLTMPTTQVNEAFKQGEAGVLAGWYSIGYEWEEEMKQVDPNVEITELLPPSATYPGRYFEENPVLRGVMIMNQTKIPEKCMQFLNYTMATEEGLMLTRYGIQDVSYKRNDNGIELMKDQNGMYLYFYPFTPGELLNVYYKLPPISEESYIKISKLETWLKSDAVPKVDRPDLVIPYDTSVMPSKDLQNTLKTFFDEETAKIITGETDISKWDDIVKQWLDMGGQQMTDDFNEQYSKMK
jgi:putative aldouronate transport system substrate-binding protein